MSIVSESQVQLPLKNVLDTALDTLSGNQQITFTQYSRIVVSDGYVFWVNNGTTFTAQGSLHNLSDKYQDEDQTIAANKVVFTSENQIGSLNTRNPSTMWIGTTDDDGVAIKFGISSGGSFYKQSGIWHYTGFAVYPALETQIVDNAGDIPTGQIVSNSLPIWLSQNSIAPVYPSFLVPDNAVPPYVVAHIEPEETEAMQGFMNPYYPGTQTGIASFSFNSEQLMKDNVKLIMYGFTNTMAIQYLNMLMNYSLNSGVFGFSNSPAIVDEKRGQVEMSVLAMKKSIKIVANYYQSAANVIAQNIIRSATLNSITLE